MNRRLLLPSFLVALWLSAGPKVAEAQCPPDARFCGEANVGPAKARVVVRGRAVAQAPTVVRHPAPAPRRVVVRAPARVIVRHPAPRVVVVRTPAPAPAPAPEVVHEPPVEPEPQPRPVKRERFRRVGLFAAGGGIFADQVSMGGFTGGLLIRPVRHLGIRLGAGAFGGTDYYGDSRTEVPFTNDFLVYFNPRRMFQIYFLSGFHISRAVSSNSLSWGLDERRYTYVGGQAGLGAELRLGRAFALTFDARTFIREQVRDGVVEFSETTSDGSVRTTNTSAGGLLNFGLAVYF